MNLIHLRYFQAVASTGSMTNASKALYVSQPAISKIISQLESEIGVPLFLRNNKKLALSEPGEVFYIHVQRILSALDEAVEATQHAAKSNLRTISVASTVFDFLAYLSPRYLEENPDIKLFQYFYSRDQITKKLLNDEIDFAICSASLNHQSLQWTPLVKCAVSLQLLKTHPLANRKTAKLWDFRDERFVVNSTGFTRSETIALCKSAGFMPNIFFETNESDTAGDVIPRFSCVSLSPICAHFDRLSRYHHDESAPTNILILSDILDMEVMGLVNRVDKVFSPVVQKFYEYISNYLIETNESTKALTRNFLLK